jgi:hypothetical protein
VILALNRDDWCKNLSARMAEVFLFTRVKEFQAFSPATFLRILITLE